MKPSRRVYKYACNHFSEMVHTTLNPEGPGVVRIHMIPPKYNRDYIGPSIAILNGMDIIPVGVSRYNVKMVKLILLEKNR